MTQLIKQFCAQNDSVEEHNTTVAGANRDNVAFRLPPQAGRSENGEWKQTPTCGDNRAI